MHSDPFTEHRELLFGIAYRMLGTVADAEDMIHETYLRWQQQDAGQVRSAKAWLIATLTRLCIDQLRSARRQREEYYGVWLPEPLVESPTPSPAEHAALADSLTMAFLRMLETLSPDERAVFLLREVFDLEYDEIAAIVDKTEPACRKIVSRAKEHVALGKPRFVADAEQADAVLRRFFEARASGDMAGLLSALADDATLISDGGGRVRAAGRPIETADHVSRFLLGIRDRLPADTQYRRAYVNSRPGYLVFVDGKLDSVLSFDIVAGRIQTIYLVRNPDKLRHIAPTSDERN